MYSQLRSFPEILPFLVRGEDRRGPPRAPQPRRCAHLVCAQTPDRTSSCALGGGSPQRRNGRTDAGSLVSGTSAGSSSSRSWAAEPSDSPGFATSKSPMRISSSIHCISGRCSTSCAFPSKGPRSIRQSSGRGLAASGKFLRTTMSSEPSPVTLLTSARLSPCRDVQAFSHTVERSLHERLEAQDVLAEECQQPGCAARVTSSEAPAPRGSPL